MRIRGKRGIAVAALLCAGAVAGVAAAADFGRIGPDLAITGNGRHLQPAGTQVALGNFPSGGAVTPDSRFYWTVSTGRGANDIRIVSIADKKVVQQIPLPGASGGIAMNPLWPVVYVSGVADSDAAHADQQQPGLRGRGGDVVHVFAYDRQTGQATFQRLFNVPPPPGTPPPQSFPPTGTKASSWPDRLAVSPDGTKLLVPLNLADTAAIVDATTGAARYVKTGSYPYGAAIAPDGTTGLVTNEADGTVSFVDLVTGLKTADVQLGHLSHPEAIAIDRKRGLAYVAVANADEVAVIDLASRAVIRTLSTARPDGGGTTPTALALTPDGTRLFVAESGADELAAFRLADWSLIGRVPTASYPTDVRVTPDSKTLVWLSGKGLGSGPNATSGPNPLQTTDANTNSFQYLPLITFGSAGILKLPGAAQIRALTPVADAQVRPANAQTAPSDTPLRPGGPIKHVFYLVRENRTYDQILGDDPRGDGQPSLTLFGQSATPNIHALVQRFPLLDHVYANSEASIQGHFWTSAAQVSDYVEKNWWQNYAGRGRPYDFGVYAVTFPQAGFLFDQADRDNVSWFNYGEAIAGDVPVSADKDRDATVAAGEARRFAHSDLGQNGCYPNDSSIGKDSITGVEAFDSSLPVGAPLGSESRVDCFRTRFNAQLATGTVPAFNYLVLPNDHTQGLAPGARTPQAMIADNDLALGQLVDLISHSPIWSSSAIFVVEDDSQDGADHVDAHRTVGAVFSPYARAGAVVQTRYDQLSIIRSFELILGLHPLGLADALATPMYDAFTSTPDLRPYTAVPESVGLLARNGSTAANRLLSTGLDLTHLDQMPQTTLDGILWKAVHGPAAVPPPPGPNAAPLDLGGAG